MVQVAIREDEPVEKTLRRFRKKVEREKILKEVRQRRYYEKPSEKRKREARAARRRHIKRLKKAKGRF